MDTTLIYAAIMKCSRPMPFTAVDTALAKSAVHRRDFKALLIKIAGVIACRHDERNKFGESGQRAKQSAILPVAKAALRCVIGFLVFVIKQYFKQY